MLSNKHKLKVYISIKSEFGDTSYEVSLMMIVHVSLQLMGYSRIHLIHHLISRPLSSVARYMRSRLMVIVMPNMFSIVERQVFPCLSVSLIDEENAFLDYRGTILLIRLHTVFMDSNLSHELCVFSVMYTAFFSFNKF